ncbi:MAG: conjugal transfer protein TraB [Micromonosporaceae bacterium]|nr:conjugal transfer protein TraB [Micromonosporaceae bacterium]
MPRQAGMPTLYSTQHRFDLAGALVPYLVTPTGCLLAWPMVAAAHQAWGTNPWAAAGITLTGSALSVLTWMAARPRGRIRQSVATTMSTLGAAWVLGATINAPWQRPWLDLWAAGTVTGSLAFAILRLLAKANPDEQPTTDSAGLREAVTALKDATLGKPKTRGAKVITPVAMPRGDTLAELEGSRDQVASYFDVESTAVRVHRNPGSVRTGRLEIVPVDQLRTPIPWAGPSAPGRSVGDAPLRFGRAEDGDPVALWLTGRPGVRPAIHLRATGMTGSGKTEWAKVMWGDYLTRTDGALIVVDTVKRDQTVKPIRPGVTLLITDDEQADAFFDLLAERVIPARTAALGEQDLSEWMPGCGLSHLLVWVEESAAWSDHPALVAVAERARTAGICLVLSQQRWTHDRAPTSLRSQFAANICFGIDGRDDPNLALSAATVDAGACPESWGASKPGYFYLEAPSIPTTRWATPCRSELADRSDITDAVTGWAPIRKPLDPTTRAALGTLMAHTDAVTTPGACRHPIPDQRQDPAMRPGVNPTDPPDDCDPSQELDTTPTPRRFSLTLPTSVDPGQARAVLRQHIAALSDQGHTELRPADLGDVLEQIGYTAAWLTKALTELTTGTTPLLMKIDRNGRYRILRPGQPA